MLDVSPGLQRMRNLTLGPPPPANGAPALSCLAAWDREKKVGRSGPVPADRLQRAPCAPTSVLPCSAGPSAAQVAEGKVVAYGVPRIQHPEPARHVFRGLPGQVLAPGEADETSDPVHVRVEGNHELRHRHPGPEPEIHAVGAPHHPAQEEVEALAGAPALRVRQQVLESPGRRSLAGDGPEVGRAQLGDEGAQRGPDRSQPPVVRGEAGAERPVRAQDRAGAEEKAGDVAGSGHPVRKPLQAAHQLCSGRGPGNERRPWTKTLQQSREPRLEEIDAAVRERRAEQRGHLHVERIGIAVRQLHRIAPDPGGGVRRGEQRVQRRPEQLRARPRPHRPSSSSRCPSSGKMRRSQASRTAAGLPGMAKTIRPSRVTPATARESMAALPISWNESVRNSSPNPGSGRAMAALTASNVLSREVMPVPPVIRTTWAWDSRARCSSCPMRAGSAGTMAEPAIACPWSASLDLRMRPPSSVTAVRVSEQVITYTRACPGARALCCAGTSGWGWSWCFPSA